MPKEPTRDLSKLPQWAQSEISRLSANETYYKNKLAAGPDDSRVFADPYGDAPRPLGSSIIEFNLDDERVRVAVKDDKGGAYLDVNGSDILQVAPRASNSVEIRVKRL